MCPNTSKPQEPLFLWRYVSYHTVFLQATVSCVRGSRLCLCILQGSLECVHSESCLVTCGGHAPEKTGSNVN